MGIRRRTENVVEMINAGKEVKLPSALQQSVRAPLATFVSVDGEGGAGTTMKSGANNHEDDIVALNAKISRRNKVFTSLAAGALAGAIAKTVIAPLDRTKINFQISSDKKYSFRGALKFLVRSYKNHGVLSMWRGNSATMARIVPQAAIQYASHEQWKHFFNPERERHLPPLERYVCGSLAGVTASTCTYPLDLARARMAVTYKSEYKSIFQVFFKIARNEGVPTLYRGFTPTVLGVIPYAGTGFFTYETLKKWHHERTGKKEPSPIQRMSYGAFAGLCGQTSSYPLDIVRRRMQTAGVTHTDHIYTSIWATLKYVLKTEGVKGGLYKGLSMNWIKGPIATGTSFMTFDLCQKQLRKISLLHIDNKSSRK